MATRIRIDFQVRETCSDGSVPETELRYVTFGDDMPTGRIRDFFERCGIATDMMFGGKRSAHVIRFDRPCNNKILAIKLVREMTGIGLKEAKDVVEQPVGADLMVFENLEDADRAMAHIVGAGVTEVKCFKADINDCLARGVNKGKSYP